MAGPIRRAAPGDGLHGPLRSPGVHEEPAPTRAVRGPAPFIGRTAELAVALADAEHHQATLVSGPAGVGKTRLAQEVAAQLAAAGWTAIVRHATPALQQLPLSLLADAVGDPPPGSSAEAIARAYRSIAGGTADGRILVVVDDAGFVDDASAVVLQRLIENRAATVLLTGRSGRALPSPLLALQRAGLLQTIELRPLGDVESRRLAVAAASAVGGAIDERRLEAICDRASGLPLFLLALVRAGGAEGTAASGRGLAELLTTVLGGDAPAERQALELVALGEPLELSIVEQACGADVLEHLERDGVIVVDRDRRRRSVRLGHPLYGEAASAELGEVRRRRLLRELADEVAKLGGRRNDVLRVALWRRDAGERVDAATALRAARAAVAGGGLDVAERLLRDALEAAPSLEAAVLLAGILLEQGRPAEVVEVCRAAPRAGDVGTRTRLGVLWAVACFDFLGDPAAARRVIAELTAELPIPWRFELDYFDITVRFYGGDVAAAVVLVDRMLADERVPARTRSWYLQPSTLALATAGRTVEAFEHASRLVDEAPSLAGEIVAVETHSRCVHTYTCVLIGRLDEVRPDLDRWRQTSEAGGDLTSAALASMCLGLLELHRGRLGAAVGLLDIPLEVSGGWALAARAWRTQAFALGGDVPAAERQLATTGTITQFAFHEPLNLTAAGDVAAAKGDVAGALGAYEAAARAAGARGAHSLAVLARLRAMALTPGDDAARRLRAACERMDGPFSIALAAVATGWLVGDLAAVQRAAAAGPPGDAVAALQLADIEAALVARLQPGSATAARAARRAAAARSALQRSLGADRRVDDGTSTSPGAPQGTVAAAQPPAAPLTAREREVIGQAAIGLRDVEIAAALGISVRTVHAHLRSAYRKLGIAGRADLRGGPPSLPR